MLAERNLLTRAPHDDGVEAARGYLRDLHQAMVASIQRGAGIDDVARLAAEAIGRPVAIIVPGFTAVVEPRRAASVRELEILERRVREQLRSHGATAVVGLAEEVAIRHDGRTIGLVAVLGSDDITTVADPAAELAGAAGLEPSPLDAWILDVAAASVSTAVLVDDARMDIEHRLRGSFLEQLRGGETLSGSDVARRAARLGCDVSEGAVMLCVEVETTRPRLVALSITDEHPGAFAQPIERSDGGPTQVWAILPAVRNASGPGGEDLDVAEATQAAAKRVATRLRQHGAVGLSRFHVDPSEFGLGLDEAELMLDVMRKVAVPPGEEIVDGTYKLLFRLLASHPDELNSYHATTIAPLVGHDDQYRTDLVRTLEVYLDTNCNMNGTADAIFAHRHTVAHRLERIHELTGLDPTVHEDREQLGLGLKIHRLTS